MRRLGRFLLLAAVVAVASAHVGSPDTVFEGAAGPYAVRVVVRLPGVVPGLADITVRTTGGPAVQTITVLPLRGGRGTAALPPADTARAVAGTSDLYTAQLWLMQFGSYSVQVVVTDGTHMSTRDTSIAVVPESPAYSGPRTLAHS